MRDSYEDRYPGKRRENDREYDRSRPDAKRGKSSSEDRGPGRNSSPDKNTSNGNDADNEPKGPDAFYCTLCGMNLNSQQSYLQHVEGKKHQKKFADSQAKRASMVEISPASLPSNRVKRINFKPKIQPELDRLTLPCVGLNFVAEIWLKDKTKDVLYYCDLCNYVCCGTGFIEHITGVKHRMEYLKAKDVRSYHAVSQPMKQSELENVLHTHAERLEKDNGRGRLTVEEERETSQKNKNQQTNKDRLPPERARSQTSANRSAPSHRHDASNITIRKTEFVDTSIFTGSRSNNREYPMRTSADDREKMWEPPRITAPQPDIVPNKPPPVLEPSAYEIQSLARLPSQLRMSILEELSMLSPSEIKSQLEAQRLERIVSNFRLALEQFKNYSGWSEDSHALAERRDGQMLYPTPGNQPQGQPAAQPNILDQDPIAYFFSTYRR